MLGTDRVGEPVVLVGETDRTDRLGEKKDVSLEDVLEKDEDLPWGAVAADDVLVERLCGAVFGLDALLRGIVPRGQVQKGIGSPRRGGGCAGWAGCADRR
jgi:hypothetical protein